MDTASHRMASGSRAYYLWKVSFRSGSPLACTVGLEEFHFHYSCWAGHFTSETVFLALKGLHLGQDFTSHLVSSCKLGLDLLMVSGGTTGL